MKKIEVINNREQLMEDIACIIDSFFTDTWECGYDNDRDDLVQKLCDSVCKNFPGKIAP